jgi:single-stranded DNA-binding protein
MGEVWVVLVWRAAIEPIITRLRKGDVVRVSGCVRFGSIG